MNDFSEITARVRYAETDQMGMVYYGNYYIYFEIGRVEFMRDARRGLQGDGRAGRQPTSSWPNRTAATFVRRVMTTCCAFARAWRRCAGAPLRFAYEILNDATGELLATGETLHVICNRQGRPKLCPKNIASYSRCRE